MFYWIAFYWIAFHLGANVLFWHKHNLCRVAFQLRKMKLVGGCCHLREGQIALGHLSLWLTWMLRGGAMKHLGGGVRIHHSALIPAREESAKP